MNTSTILPLSPVANGAPSKRKMSLDNTEDGIRDMPMRLLVYGAEKIGKSTFAAGAPNPIFLGTDRGTSHLNIKRLPVPDNFSEALEGLYEVEMHGRARGFQTLVVDPLNWFEAMVVADVLGDSGKSLNAINGGYGAGGQAVLDRWRQLRQAMERVWLTGMHVVITAHAHVKKFEDPEGPSYERWELAMKPDPAGMFKQWCDAVMFARQDAFGKVDPTTKKVKAYGSSARMLHTERAPAFDAGNRWMLPAEIPLSWAAFMEARANGIGRRNVLIAEIEEGLAELRNPEVEAKVRGYLADPKANVQEIANAVAAKVGEHRGAVTSEKETSHEQD